MKRTNNDKIIKDFFSNVCVFLKWELDKPNTNQKAIEHNIGCMLMFGSNPAKFIKPKEIKRNALFFTSDGLGDELFNVVKQMIVAVHIHYNVEPKGAFCAEKRIPQLYRQARSIILKNIPVYALKQIVFNKNLDRMY
ncbi:MAG: hypothetical protein ACLRFJ_00500 [Alphaproteobacteria bacterium]